jgi:inner membrane protein
MSTKTINNNIERTPAKAIFSAIILLGLFLGLKLVEGLLSERQNRQDSAINELASNWGEKQTISGPFLAVPYSGPISPYQSETAGYLVLPPENLEIKSELTPETRSRGIYEAVLYDAKVSVIGNFTPNSIAEYGIPADQLNWKKSVLIFDVSDSRRMIGNPFISMFGKNTNLEAGVPDKMLIGQLHALAPDVSLSQKEIPFNLEVRLRGSELFSVDPLATNVSIDINSTWKDPSFFGSMLPSNREVTKEGFNAHWELSKYQTSIPKVWEIFAHNEFLNRVNRSSVGVKLISTTDSYVCTERALKHGVLIIVLVLGIFFLFELVVGINIHPLQYTLVGAALVLFYLALLSLTEVYSFSVGYILAALLSTSMISLYAKAILGSISRASIIMLMQGITYIFLYVVLTLEDFSLLFGTVGLSLVVAAIMYATRDLNAKISFEESSAQA